MNPSRRRSSTFSALSVAKKQSRASWRLLPLALFALPLLAFLGLPLLALLLQVEPATLVANLANPAATQAISLSLVTSLAATLLAITLGTPLAFLLARRRFRGRVIIDTLIDLPMILPPSVAGIALLMAFGRRGLLGSYFDAAGVSIAFTQMAVVLAQLFVAAPFYVKAATAGFVAVERELEQAAALDGATGWGIFRHVTAPLAWPALFGGAMMSWARALGEFGATIIFAGNFPGRTQTMPLAIYVGFEIDLGIAVTLATILLALSFAILFLVKGIVQQRVGSVGGR